MSEVPTQRLYYVDPYLTTFESRVVGRKRDEGGDNVALDRSAFYPEGGGQPADHGWLNQVQVVDVQAVGDVVWHTLAEPLSDDQVEGRVDWDRRFDHMQQHHGQHLLSAAFEDLFGFATASFHLGDRACTIDLAAPEVTTDQLTAAETLANRVIWEGRPVDARFVTREELASIPLRKPPTVSGAIRVVSVRDFDHSACGGTHPTSTGAVGILHARRLERRGEGMRVEFACGGRVLREVHQLHGLVQRVAAELTVGVDELEGAVLRQREAERAARKAAEAATRRLLDVEAGDLVSEARQVAGLPVVCRAYRDRSIDEVSALARAIASLGALALLGAGGRKPQLVFAVAREGIVECGALLRGVVQQFGGRGGGQAGWARGGIRDSADLDAALAQAMRQLESESVGK